MAELEETLKRVRKEYKDFYDEAFRGYDNIPEDIKKIAIRICDAYGIRGICDPVYICNIIAVEQGRGDGKSNFTK